MQADDLLRLTVLSFFSTNVLQLIYLGVLNTYIFLSEVGHMK